MTRLVAIDTSTWWGGVALVRVPSDREGPETVAEAGLQVPDSHSVHVLALLEPLLSEAGWARSAVDAYAATRGPGSFTGIRVALGTIRGLGLASDRPCFGIGTLEALAEAHGPDDRDRVPMLDAGRGEVYAARYSPQSSPPRETIAPWVGPPESASKGDGPDLPAVFGPGARRYAEVLEAIGLPVRTTPRSVAAAAGRLAARALAAGDPHESTLAPLYIRPPDAVLK